MSTSTPHHEPVLLRRCLDLLGGALGADGAGVVIDGTLGLGGHTLALLETFPRVHVIGIDRDTDALARTRERLAEHADRITLAHARYDEMDRVCEEAGIEDVDGILLDLGVSSMQLDRADRGFAYAQDAPLDMRMDSTTGHSAIDVLNSYSAKDLARVLRRYGEEPFAQRIARTIVAERAITPIMRSTQLVDIVRRSVPAAARRTGGNPAKRTFQALRIEVNGELDSLQAVLPTALDLLKVGGRLVVMSYQSLEDRLVKKALAAGAASIAPPDLPIEPEETKARMRMLTRGAEVADPGEIEANPRSASVRLRAVERIRPQLRRAVS